MNVLIHCIRPVVRWAESSHRGACANAAGAALALHGLRREREEIAAYVGGVLAERNRAAAAARPRAVS